MKKICTYLMFLSLTFAYSSCKKSANATKASGSGDTIIITNTVKKPFNVYGFIVYGGYVQNGANLNTSYAQIQQYLLTFGIKQLNLIYESKLLDYPNGDTANGVPNINRIDSLANQALADPTTPVSFDLEGWNRLDTVTTPTRMISVIKDFKKINAASPVSLYATVPQNTYGYSATTQSTYNKYNKGYASVAAQVDYFSPSLYNYNGVDSVAWKNAATYNVQACNVYGFTSKKIIPYVTPEVTVNGVTTLLSYNDMLLRLQTLYNLGADGCLVWTSSSTRDVTGNKIYVDVSTGWAKAMVDFVAAHRN